MRTARCDGGVARPLHAEDHSPPPTEAAHAGPTESGRVPRASVPPLPGRFGRFSPSDRRLTAVATRLEREREAESPGRGPGLGVTPSRSAQRLGANRSGHVYRLCARAIRRSTSTTAHVPRNPEGVPVYSAKRISNQRYRLERAASGDSRGPVTPLCEAEFACSAEGFLPV